MAIHKLSTYSSLQDVKRYSFLNSLSFLLKELEIWFFFDVLLLKLYAYTINFIITTNNNIYNNINSAQSCTIQTIAVEYAVLLFNAPFLCTLW